MKAKFKASIARAYQVAVYSFVGSAGVGNIGPLRDLAGVKSAATIWGLSGLTALASGFIAFLLSTVSNGASGFGVDHLVHGAKKG